MPKKRRLTKANAEHLEDVLADGFSSLATVRSILRGYFKRDEKPSETIERLVKHYRAFQDDCRHEFMRRLKE